MSHFTGGFIFAGVMIALGIAAFVHWRTNDTRPGGLYAAIAFLSVGVIQLFTTVVSRSASKTDAGDVETARLVETAAGPRVVTIDVLEHMDILGLLDKHGGGITWKEHRLGVFDLTSGAVVSRISFDGGEPASVAVDIGGLIGLSKRTSTRLVDPVDGHELADLGTLRSKIREANPTFDVRSAFYDDSSGCLAVTTDAFEIKVDPRHFQVVEHGACHAAAGTGEQRVAFDAHTALAIRPAESHLPPGATSTAKTIDGVVEVEGTRASDTAHVYKNARFATDSRTTQPMFVGEPRAAVLLHVVDESPFASAISPTGAALWKAPLPSRLLELTVLDKQLVAISGTKVAVIDGATGKVTRELELR